MKVSEAKFTRRYNVAQYEHEEYSLSAVVEEGDDAVACLNILKNDVALAYAGESAGSTANEAGPEVEESNDDETPEEDVKPSRRSRTTTPKETDSGDDGEVEADEDTGSEDDEPVSEASKYSGKEKSKKTFKKKPQVYQRDNETYKDLFAGLLKGIAPDWKKSDAGKAKAKKASIEMEGEDFLDGDGEILPTFKVGVKKLMGKK